MRFIIQKVCLLFLTCLYQYGTAQPKFSASIYPSSIGKNETVEFKLMVENANDVQQIVPPSFKNFDVISGPMQESQMLNVNGVTTQYVGISFVLKPKAPGNFTIGTATAKVDGKTLQSNVVKIEVTNSTAVNSTPSSPFAALQSFDRPAPQASYKDLILKKGENVAEKISKNLFVKLEVNRQSCYVGEPVTVSYKLYTRLKSESGIVKNPSFNGFSVVDLIPPGNSSYTIEKMNGRDYNVYTLRKSQLYPLQPGDLELESIEVDNTIQFIKEEYARNNSESIDNFLREMGSVSIPSEGITPENITLKSKPAIIHVIPLPEKDKPESFKGAVGDFAMQATIEKNNFTTDDAGKLIVTVSGSGNMMLVNAPDIVWPDNTDVFETKATENIDKSSVPVNGSKYFEYPFTVSKPGEYTLPPITFSYFDIKEGKYKTVNTKPISFTVSKGDGKAILSLNDIDHRSDKERFFDRIFKNRSTIIIPIALLIISGLIFWVRKDNKHEKMAKANMTTEDAAVPEPEVITATKKPLAETEEKLYSENKSGFYNTLNREFRTFLALQFSIPLEEVNKRKIGEEADKKGVDLSITLQIQQLLDEIEWQLYTPFPADEKMQDMYESADRIIYKLNSL